MKKWGTAVRAFSVAEALIAICLSALILSAMVMFFQNVTHNQKRLATIESVTLTDAIVSNFYGLEDTDTVSVYSAPNFGRSAFANELRELFWEDHSQASAVYCLGRDGLNTIRPSSIDYPDGSAFLDTPSRFLAHLQSEYGSAADVYVDYEGPSVAEDATIYMIGPSASATELNVIATYEMDIVPILDASDNTIGNYVSVRRYLGSDLASYYDVYYEVGTGNAFSPLLVHFPKASNASYESDATAARFMVAGEHSFYLMWWPDPAAHFLEAPSPPQPSAPDYSATDPVMDYWKMGGRTSFMFAVPMFPASY